MRVNAFGLAAGWKLCAKMRLSLFTHMIFRARNWKPRKFEVDVGKVATPVHILAVDDFRLLWMQPQLAAREGVDNRAPECPRLLGALAVTNDVVRVSLERDVRKRPRHPRIERVMQEQVRQQREITPPCGVPAVRGTTLPSSICTGAFSQRSMLSNTHGQSVW